MMSEETIQVLAISGSLRKAAFNTALLHAAQQLAPQGMSIQIYADLASIPPYDDDIRVAGYPPVVATLRDRVRAADALIFATPEYNRSFPGVLKNAIDWMSRPPAQPLDGKPAAVMGAGPGVLAPHWPTTSFARCCRSSTSTSCRAWRCWSVAQQASSMARDACSMSPRVSSSRKPWSRSCA